MTVTIGRRELLAALGGAAVVWPLAARAQRAGKLPTIGFFGPNTASAWRPWTAAFVQRLRELGWIEGRNLAIEYRWADARSERFAEIAAEFVRLKVDVIVTGGNAAVAAKQVSSVVTIVFALLDDPVSMGLIASLARPGGNATGFMVFEYGIGGKWLELLKEVAPGVTRVAALRDPATPSGAALFGVIQAMAPSLRVEVNHVNVREATDVGRAVTALAQSANGGLIVLPAP